jgi:hypothetical protein
MLLNTGVIDFKEYKPILTVLQNNPPQFLVSSIGQPPPTFILECLEYFSSSNAMLMTYD